MDACSESVGLLFRLKRKYFDRKYIERDTSWPYRGGRFSLTFQDSLLACEVRYP